MAHTYIVFDFGTNEEASQQARHRVEGWKQGYRLGNKLLMKFERKDGATEAGDTQESGKSKKKTDEEKTENVRVLIRLDFSDHEKLSFTRWLERIPKDESFKPAKTKTVKQGEAEFEELVKLFDSLD